MTCRPTDLTGQGDSGGGDGVAVPARGSQPVGGHPPPQTRRGAVLLPLRRSRRRPGERTKAGEHPEGRRDDADTGGIETQQARALWQSTAGRPRTRALVSIMLFCGFRVSQDIGLHMANVAYAEVDTTGWPIPEAAADVLAAVGR